MADNDVLNSLDDAIKALTDAAGALQGGAESSMQLALGAKALVEARVIYNNPVRYTSSVAP